MNKIPNKDEMISLLDCIFGDNEYDDLPIEIRNLINEYKYDIKNESVLCIPNYRSPINTIMNNLDKSLYELISQDFASINRQDAENFSKYIQLVTATMVHDGENMLLLNNLYSNKVYQRGTLSYIQGHVEFPYAISLSLKDILIQNMIKEINEELGMISGNIDDVFEEFKKASPVTAMYLPIPPSTNKHCCILYELKVDDVNDFYCKENNKNGINIIKIDKIYSQYNYLCPWVLQSLQYSEHVRRIYIEHLRGLNY